ncbi:hypothetical protein LSTR_LSTR014886 [Laodelphax striatellus]|uniref:Plastocyanin-like domain-containing protein n=1 Tax=Laodelphax striatellus TaxID=195883 RepID=A0A482WV45_LAOST|nr:hypothetical protein LSTR_LSTR014886 [Laodelphax striatellus]
MDGVPMITQCPILEHQIFRYTFKPDNPGLFFWHSHSGLQKLDGFEGSMIVRQPESQQHYRDLYDYDLPSHIIFLQDWLHVTADEFYQGLKTRTLDQFPVTYLINGRARSKTFNGSDYSKTPFTVYKIRKDFSYLFHIISGTCLICPVRLQIENHLMTIVGTDGRDAQPKTVGSVTLGAEIWSIRVVACRGQKRLHRVVSQLMLQGDLKKVISLAPLRSFLDPT